MGRRQGLSVATHVFILTSCNSATPAVSRGIYLSIAPLHSKRSQHRQQVMRLDLQLKDMPVSWSLLPQHTRRCFPSRTQCLGLRMVAGTLQQHDCTLASRWVGVNHGHASTHSTPRP